MADEPAEAPANPVKFGTFTGVFTPTLLTILGVIMFVRLPWVVGNGGLLGGGASEHREGAQVVDLASRRSRHR